MVTAMGSGTAIITVSAEGRNAPVTITVIAAPAIQLSPTTVSLNALQGQTAAETVNVTNAGGGTLSGLSGIVTYASGEPTGWLTASLNSTMAPATLALQASAANLQPGTYSATVTIRSSLSGVAEKSVSVTFTVGQGPVIGLSATSLSFSAMSGGTAPAAETVSVTNTGGGTLSGLNGIVTYGSGQTSGWLVVSLNSTTAPATLTLRPSTVANGLPLQPGTYNATVVVRSSVPGVAETSASITFTVTAAPQPQITVSPTSVSFSVTAGQGNPASQTVSVTNAGTGTLSGLSGTVTYSAGQPGGWLAAALNSTTAPAILTLTASTGSLAAGIYTATVTLRSATSGVAERSVNVTFTVVQPTASCSNPLNLRVGETVTAVGVDAAALCIGGGASGAEFVVVPFHASAAGSIGLSVTGEGVAAVVGSPNPSVGVAQSRSVISTSQAYSMDRHFEERLHKLSVRELSPRIPDARAIRASRRVMPNLSLSGAPPEVGDLLTLNTQANSACTSPSYRTARVAAITSKAIVVADTLNPAGGFTDEEYRSFGIAFDTLVYPVSVQNFNSPTDIDGNGKVIIFFTKAVNDLTPSGSTSYVGGFFFSRDLFPKQSTDRFQGCAGSNEAEMFYMLVPDPSRGGAFTKTNVQRGTVGVIAHELQHLINASRRLYVNNASGFEEIWLNEGLSHIAEELIFYRRSGLNPKQNIDLARIQSSAQILDAFNAYQISNFGRLGQYLRNTEGNSPYASNADLATRGATWQFLRYAADRSGQSDSQLWTRLVNSTTSGHANLRAALGTDPLPWFQDWSVSVYTDDAVLGTETRYIQPSWHYRSILPALSSNAGVFPLQTRQLVDRTSTSLSLVAGGSAYLRFGVAPAGQAAIRIAAGASAPPATLSVSLVRTR
jgi:hypothetical protein